MAEILKIQYKGEKYNGLERRRFPRFNVNFSAEIAEIKDISQQEGLLVLEVNCMDISSQGVGLVASSLFTPQTPLELKLEVPERKEPLQLSGKVIWVSKIEKGAWRVGICFDTLQFKVMGKIGQN